MKVCFMSTSWVREKEILEELNQHVNLFFVMPYKPNGNYSITEVSDFCEQHKINHIIDDSRNHRARSFYRFKKDIKLISKIKKFKADVIYIETFGSPYFALLSRLLLGNKKVIIAIMDFKLHQRSAGTFKFSEKFYRYVQVSFFKYFQFFSHTQNKLFKKEYPKKKSFAIRLFLVDKDLHQHQKREPNDKVNFLFFGRVFYYKGVDILIKAANILANKHQGFKVTIAGNTKVWKEEYQPLTEEQSVFDLKIRFITKEELPDLFAEADYFIAPYREVTQSGPLLRAYNYDIIPIVSSEEGFVEYVEHNKTGFIFENEDENSLVGVMEKALLLGDIEKEKMLRNIDEFKKAEFDMQYVINKYIQMFKDVNGNLNKKLLQRNFYK